MIAPNRKRTTSHSTILLQFPLEPCGSERKLDEPRTREYPPRIVPSRGQRSAHQPLYFGVQGLARTYRVKPIVFGISLLAGSQP